MGRVSELGAQPLYDQLRPTDKEKFMQRSPLQVEEFQRIEKSVRFSTEETPDRGNTKELDAFEQAIEPYQKLLEPESPTPNWLQRTFDNVRRAISDRPHRRFRALKTQQDVQEFFYQNSLGEKNHQPFNPAYLVESTGTSRIAKLISFRCPAIALRQAGLWNLNADQLAKQGLVIQDLRNYRRYPEDLPELFGNINSLANAGFSQNNFDAMLWTLDDIAKAYNTDPVQLSAYFGMNLRSLIAAGVAHEELPKYNITMEHIMQDVKPFEILFALKMDPVQLNRLFKFNPAHVYHPTSKEPLLSTLHFDVLHTYANWNDTKLKQIGFTDEQIKELGAVQEMTIETLKAAVTKVVRQKAGRY